VIPTPSRARAVRLALVLVALIGAFAAASRAEIPARIDQLERQALLHESRAQYDQALQLYLDEVKELSKLAPADAAARREIGARGELALLLADPIVREIDAFAAADDALAEVVSRPIDPSFQARAILQRWSWQRSRSDVPAPPATPEGLGSITDWMLIGPFDDEQGGGFDRGFPPEKELQLGATYDGKDRQVSWRRVPVVGKAAVNLGATFTPNEQCLAYALCAVRCERETPVAIRLATSGAVKAFVNGSAVLTRTVRRQRRFDQDAVGVLLPAGWSSLLLEVAQRTGDWSFSARLTDPSGAPLSGVEVTADPQILGTLSFATGAPAKIAVGGGARETFEARVAADPSDAWARFHLAVFLDRVKALDEGDTTGLGHLNEATRLDPENPFFFYERAHASLRPAEMSPEREENAFRRDLEALLALDPEHVQASVALAHYYLDTLHVPSRAEAFVDAALKVNPDCLEARLLKRHVLELHDLDAQADRILVDTAANPALARCTRFLDEWISHLVDRKRTADARVACFRALIADRRDTTALDSLATVLENAGRPDAALAALAEWSAAEPYETSAMLRQARLLEAYGRTDDAVALLRRAVEIDPQDDARRQQLAILLHRVGRPDEALAELSEAKRLNPKNPWTERYLQFLRGEKRPFEAEIATDPTALAESARAVTASKNEPFSYLLRDTTVKANADGTATRYDHFVAKVLNKRGVMQFDRFPIPYAVGEQEVEVLVNRVIHPDGSATPGRVVQRKGEERGEYQTWDALWVDLPTIDVGDVVEMAYRVKDVTQSFFGDYFGYSHEFYGRDLAPVKDSRFTLIRPKSRHVYLNVKNGAPEAEEGPGDEEGTVAYRFEMKDLPGVDAEPFMPPPSEFTPSVEATTYGSWDEFSGWWWNLVKRELEPSDAMKAKVKELTEGLDDVTAKARALYDFVVTDVRYEAWEFGVHGYKPYQSATVFDRRFGDCKDKAILLCTLLHEIGVKATPILIHADMDRAKEDLSLPLVSHFNHCIAHAELPSGPIFLDGTAQFHAMGTIPDMDRGAHVLNVVDGRSELVQVPEPAPDENLLDEGYEVVIAEDGSATIKGVVQAAGTAAVDVRARFVNPGRRDDAISARFGDLFGKARVLTSRFSDLRNLEEATHYSFEVAVSDVLKRTSGEPTVPLALTPHSLRGFAATQTRKFDVLLPPARTFRSKLRYRFPASFEPVALPEPKNLETPFGNYRQTARKDGDDVVIESQLALDVRRVASADYPAFREFCLETSDAEDGVLRLRPVTAPENGR
jgi:transglutaminase-like putative cysteine protease